MMKITPIYESESLIAVNKPDGMLSIPADKTTGDSLFSLLSAGFEDRLFIVHRLDRDASGVILFAKNAAAHRSLNEQFSRRFVIKEYRALVHGEVEKKEGEIDRPIREFGSGRMGVDEGRGKPSQTHYLLTEKGAGYSLLTVRPTTGRRHQIRVHFYSLGHPLVGDRRYGELAVQQEYPRLMLHAEMLHFTDPLSGADLKIEAPVPDSFQRVCDELL